MVNGRRIDFVPHFKVAIPQKGRGGGVAGGDRFNSIVPLGCWCFEILGRDRSVVPIYVDPNRLVVGPLGH